MLSGVGVEVFRARVKTWEKRGFPQINPENGKRPIPSILAYWGLPQNHSHGPVLVAIEQEDDEDGEINFGGSKQGQRRAS